MANRNKSKPFDRAEHCRAIGRLGGKATYQKHGASHLSAIGVRGFRATAKRFGSVARYKRWLAHMGAVAYQQQTMLPNTGKFGVAELWAPWNKPDVPF